MEVETFLVSATIKLEIGGQKEREEAQEVRASPQGLPIEARYLSVSKSTLDYPIT